MGLEAGRYALARGWPYGLHADDLGLRPLVAHCHLGLGQLHRRTGKRKKAQEHLGIARAMYREVDIGCVLSR